MPDANRLPPAAQAGSIRPWTQDFGLRRMFAWPAHLADPGLTPLPRTVTLGMLIISPAHQEGRISCELGKPTATQRRRPAAHPISSTTAFPGLRRHPDAVALARGFRVAHGPGAGELPAPLPGRVTVQILDANPGALTSSRQPRPRRSWRSRPTPLFRRREKAPEPPSCSASEFLFHAEHVLPPG
jgi:hypothetical protein